MPGEYADGGPSGATLERPALKRLLDDIAAGTIDIVVVYKVDRLTRSLLDVAKLVEPFDKAGHVARRSPELPCAAAGRGHPRRSATRVADLRQTQAG